MNSDSSILVLAAMDEESGPIVERLEDVRDQPVPFRSGTRALSGTFMGQQVTVVTTGVGTVASSAAATWGGTTLSPRAVISAGTAGGLGTEVEVGDVVVGAQYTYSIADATAFGYAAGQVPGGPERFEAEASLLARAIDAAGASVEPTRVHGGLMVSGDAFVTAPIAEPMRERFPGALSADMESTAIAQVCASLDLPFVSLRAISDLCGPRADQQFHLEVDLAAEVSARAVEHLLEALTAKA